MKIKGMLLSLLFPNNCAFCKKGVAYNVTETYICDECMENLTFCIRSHRCSLCGTPIDNPEYSLCSECFIRKKNGIRIYFNRITAPIVYDNFSKNAVICLKNEMFLGAVLTFCHMIESMVKSDFEGVDFDYIVSVPPRQERMRETNFDQAEIIAANLAKIMRIKYIPKCMKRLRKTEKQSELSFWERNANLDGAFGLRRHDARFKDKTILVIDDVCTTGTTMNECARVLKQKGGAAKVYGAAIAKTVKA